MDGSRKMLAALNASLMRLAVLLDTLALHSRMPGVHTYLAHQETPPPRTLQ